METPSLELAAMVDIEGGASATLRRLDDGSIRITRFDHGIAPELALGGDMERWLDIPAD